MVSSGTSPSNSGRSPSNSHSIMSGGSGKSISTRSGVSGKVRVGASGTETSSRSGASGGGETLIAPGWPEKSSGGGFRLAVGAEPSAGMDGTLMSRSCGSWRLQLTVGVDGAVGLLYGAMLSLGRVNDVSKFTEETVNSDRSVIKSLARLYDSTAMPE